MNTYYLRPKKGRSPVLNLLKQVSQSCMCVETSRISLTWVDLYLQRSMAFLAATELWTPTYQAWLHAYECPLKRQGNKISTHTITLVTIMASLQKCRVTGSDLKWQYKIAEIYFTTPSMVSGCLCICPRSSLAQYVKNNWLNVFVGLKLSV